MMKIAFVILIGLSVCCMGVMDLITLPDAVTSMGAMCLDGSPAAYYFKPASKKADETKWILFFQGGGWCYNENDCLGRTDTDRGSSKNMPPNLTILGMMNDDPEDNPDFYSWNHVVFAYCDGASFTGAAEEPVVVNNTKLYFRGYFNLQAIMKDLLTNRGMKWATEVLLSGESAGGLATYIHADQIGEMLPSSVKRYKAAPVSGLFLKQNNVNGEPVYENQMKNVFIMQNSSIGVDSRCLLSKSPMYMYLCMFASETARSLETPLFVMNSIYDGWSLRCIFTAEPLDPSSSMNGNCTAAPGWSDCIYSKECTSEQWNEFNTKWGDDYRTMLDKTSVFHNRGNGIYAYSCYYHDAEITGHWNKIKIDGVSIREAFTKWYRSTDEDADKHTYIDCKINGNFLCNPTCAN